MRHTASAALSRGLILGCGLLAITVHGGILAAGALCLSSAGAAGAAGAAAAVLELLLAM